MYARRTLRPLAPTPTEEIVAAQTQEWFKAHKSLAKLGGANDHKPSLSQWRDLVAAFEPSKNTNAIAERLNPKTAGAKSWKHKDAKAVLEKLNRLQSEQRKLYARFFVRWLRAEIRKEAR